MEYVFGTKEDAEILKTKGVLHSSLTGYHEVVREYPDQTITDKFRIVKKYQSSKDAEGNCYDWYIIDNHYRFTDKWTPSKAAIEGEIGENQNAIFDVADLADENSNGLLDLADYMSIIDERVTALEG